MNDAQIPIDLEAEQQQTALAERQAQQRLQQQELQRLSTSNRLSASLKAIAGNADFEYWMTNYLASDVAIKLQQLATCPVHDLALARQRWLDAQAMLNDLKTAVSEATEK